MCSAVRPCWLECSHRATDAPCASAPQVETGELSLQCAVFSPARLVADVLQACRMGCAAGAEGGTGIELESTCGTGDESLPPMVEADRDRIAQVLQNLARACLQFCCCLAH